MNTERLAHRHSVIVLHDCCPGNIEMTECAPRQGSRTDCETEIMWTGDVWKLLPILHEYRSDLRQIVLDCPPTGLVVLTNLDPSSNVLHDKYDEIVRKFAAVTLDKFGLDRFRTLFPPVESRSLVNNRALRDLLGRLPLK